MTNANRQRLKALREFAGISQYRLAQLAGITRNRLSLYECGYVQLRESEYSRLEEVMREAVQEAQDRVSATFSEAGVSADTGGRHE